jgi:hypothetical protein
MHFSRLAREWSVGHGPYLRSLYKKTREPEQTFDEWLVFKRALIEDYSPATLFDFACLLSY